jgi:PAS domain S-box-containing protein
VAFRYGCAAASIALATWVRVLFDPVVGNQFPYATVFFAVLVTAWYGGMGPAMAAAVLGAVTSYYFLIPPRGSFGLKDIDQYVGLVLYLSTSLGIALVGGAMHAERRRTEATPKTEQPRAAPGASAASSSRWITGLLLLGIGLFLVPIAVFLFSLEQARQADASVRHTLEVIIALNEVEGALVDKQAGARGYVITGQEKFLEPYQAGLQAFPEALRHAQQLTLDNPEQQRNLRAVDSLNERWEEYARNLIELARTGAGAARARSLVATGLGKSLMESLRAELSSATRLEVRLLAERERRDAAVRTVLIATVLMFVAGGLLSGVAQFVLARRLESQRLALVAEIASREAAELRFRHVVEAAPNPMVIADNDGRITLVNSQSLAKFGYEREELIGQPIEVLVPERFRAGHAGYRNGYLIAPVARPMGTGRDLFGRRKDGSEFPVDISLSPVDTADGMQVIAAVTDITEHKLAQEKLRQANQALASANKELEAFAYSTSHDLRQPLRGMTGFAEILLQDYGGKLDAAGKDYLQRIQAAAKRMGQLIDDLLGLARVSRGTLRREEVNLSSLASAALSELRQGQPRDGVTVEIQPGLVATGDPPLLQAMLGNLLGNAWKFTGKTAQGRIEFGSTTAEGERAFFVRDNGAGFDMAYANKLFGAFQRLHSAQEFAGTGIGLATVQRIVHRHGGRIWAQAAKNQGATFFFTLG